VTYWEARWAIAPLRWPTWAKPAAAAVAERARIKIEIAINTSDNFVMFEQFATAGGGTALLDGFDELGLVFKLAVCGCHRREALEPGFFFW
jgi:hypothetical protein